MIIFCFSVILAFFASSVFAKPVSQNEAHGIALNLTKDKKYSIKLKTKKSRHLQARFSNEIASQDVDVLYYVFEIGENSFAIIAGDDIFKPVLGFSENGKFDYADMPPNFAWYLQNLERELEYALQNGQTASLETQIEWEKYAANPYIIGTNLIKTTWSQESPYNNMCPISGSAVTGCVATAMSQIMKHHGWPLNISSNIPAYNTKNLGISVPTINRQNFSYDWANMANSYSGTTTTAQKNAVATIMYHAGASVQMDYNTSSNGSGAYATDIPKAMSMYFDYDKNIRFITKNGNYYRPEDYTAIGSSSWTPANDSILPYIWDDIMKIQIDSLLPVIYSGNPQDKSSGHSFILDGYDNSGKFHFNWGWRGDYDGWFVSTVLNPSTHNYSYDQDATINIMPNLYGTGNSDLRIFGRNLRMQKSLVARGEIFTVNPTIYNIGTATSPRGKILGIAIFNSEEQFKIIGIAELDSVMSFTRARELTNSSYLRGDFSLEVQSVVPPDISPGSYILRAVIKNENNEWEILKTAKNYLNEATITVDEEILSDNSNIRLGGEIKLTSNENNNAILQDKPLEINVSVCNNGTNTFIGKISVEIGNVSNSDVEKIAENWVAIPVSNTCKTINLYSNSITSSGGEYILSAMAENLSSEKKLIEEYQLGSYIHYKNQIPVYIKGLVHGNLIVNNNSAIASNGYTFVDSLNLTLSNIGQNSLTSLELNFKQGIFASSKNIESIILPENSNSLKFAPVLDLEIGTYKDTLIITGDNGIYLLHPLEFKVVPTSEYYTGSFDITPLIFSKSYFNYGAEETKSTNFINAGNLAGLVANFGKGTAFELVSSLPSELSFNSSTEISIKTKSGLLPNVYTDTLFITGNNGVSAKLPLEFEIAKINVMPSEQSDYDLRLSRPTTLTNAKGDTINNSKIFQDSALIVKVGIRNIGTNNFSGKIVIIMENEFGSEIIGEKNVSIPVSEYYYPFDFNNSKINSIGGNYKISVLYTTDDKKYYMVSSARYVSFDCPNPTNVFVVGLYMPKLEINGNIVSVFKDYNFVDSLDLTLSNIGQNTLTNLKLSFKQGIFASNKNIESIILPGNSNSLKFAPILGLGIGTYKDTLIITGDNNVYSLYPLEFEVTLPTAIKWNSIIAEIPQNVNVRVYNIKGKLVAKSETIDNIRNLALPPGIYIVKIRGEKFNLSKKIIVTM
jgi:hypothetical protein